MQISARNRIKGTVSDITLDEVAAKVRIDIGGGNSITAVITRDSADEMHLSEGDQVEALIKATSVMVIK